MKRTTPILMLVLMLLLTAWMMPATAEENPTLLTLYEGPKTMRTSATAKVTANGNDLFVYDVMVNHEHIWNANTQPTTTPMTYFDFEGKVRIEVEMPGLPDKVESAAVIPQAWGITPEVKDGKVSFIITEPGQYTVVFNDNVNKALHIFANPLETDVPDPDDPNVYYIPSGEWVMDAITLEDGQTLYISGGAVLHTIISVNNAKNVRICGRGIIDGSDYDAWNQPGSYARVPIDLNHAKNVTIDGIIVANSNCWNVNSYSSKHVEINNVKVISGRQNGDGFTFQSCTDHTVTNSFARTWDDSLVIKNYSGSTRASPSATCRYGRTSPSPWKSATKPTRVGRLTPKSAMCCLRTSLCCTTSTSPLSASITATMRMCTPSSTATSSSKTPSCRVITAIIRN